MLRRSAFKKQKGFTLIELIVVVSILLVLVLIAIPRYQDVLLRTRETHDRNAANEVSKSISRAVASGNYRLTATTFEKYNSGSWETITDVIAEMETNDISPVGSPETGDQYVVKITDGKIAIFVDDTQIYP